MRAGPAAARNGVGAVQLSPSRCSAVSVDVEGISVDAASEADIEEALDRLLAIEPNLDYGNFQPIAARTGAAEMLHRRRWLDAQGRIAVLLARDRGGHPLALLRSVERPFESAHFGMRMARIEMPLAGPDSQTRLAALSLSYRSVCDRLRNAGYAHGAFRVSTRDPAAAWALQLCGAVHVDTQVSWMCPLSRMPHDEPLPGGLAIEQHDRASIAGLAPSSWRRMADWAGRAFDRGPLVFDLSLAGDRARSVYSEWTARVMRGEWADAVLVARRGEEVVAFISMLRMDDVSEAAGLTVCGHGLGATLPEYRGLFTAIQREMIARRPLDADFMENETQVSTIGSINVYAKLGMRYLRSTSTFHRRLDGSEPGAS